MVIWYRRGRTFAKGELYPDLAVGSTRGSAELEGSDPGGVLQFG